MTDHWAHLTQTLRTLEAADTFSGIVRIVEGESVVFESCHGLANRADSVPITPATRFQTASLCKMFTAVAALVCVRDGLLTTETRVVDILPPERRSRSLDPATTIHHLLTHTSGMGDYAEEDEALPGYVEDYASLWRDLPMYRMETIDDFLPLYTDKPPVSSPGTAFHYNNAAFIVLGAVIEEVTGEDFPTAMARLVFQPVGMDETGYPRLDEPHPHLATGYLPAQESTAIRRSNIYSVPVAGGPDGGAVATAADIDRLLRAIHTETLLGPALTRQMLTPHVEIRAGESMGYGVSLRADGAFGKDGGDPGVETLCRFFPRHNASVVVLANIDNSPAEPWVLPFAPYQEITAQD